MRTRDRAHRIVAAAASAAFGAALLVGCSASTETAKVSCSLQACTVTVNRGVNGSAKVLGVPVKIVDVTDTQVTVEVGGDQIVVPVDGSAQESGGLSVQVQQVTADQVILKISKAG